MFRHISLGVIAVVLLCRGVVGEPLAVHVGYVVPVDRAAQTSAESNLWEAARLTQAWYAEQMDRWGFGPKTFQLDSFGGTRTVFSATTAAAIRSNIWSNNIDAAIGSGLPVWNRGEVWFLASNSHIIQVDGTIQGGTALGASFGSADDPGVAMLGGNAIPFLSLDAMRDETPYDGLILPDVGSQPLVQDISHPWFEGTTVSSVASSLVGAMAHELGHAFGLPHNFLNDSNFDGPLLGNGLRGMRGVFAPEEFGNDDTWLSYASALALSTSRYFNASATFSDNIKPSLSIGSAGNVQLVDGSLHVDFAASDPSGLSAAILLRNGDVVAAMPLQGNSVDTALVTPYFDADVTADYQVRVYDSQGNLQTQTVAITPKVVDNVAPQPFVDVSKTIMQLGDSLTLDASRSLDPDAAGLLAVEWDLDGDGVFDTAPSNDLFFSTTLTTPGTQTIVARLTDDDGTVSLSAPIAIRVLGETGDYNSDEQIDGLDLALWQSSFGNLSTAYYGGDSNGDASVSGSDFLEWQRQSSADLASVSANASQPVPEPASTVLLLLAFVTLASTRQLTHA